MGVDPKKSNGRIVRKVTGTSKGMGGSMHIFSKEKVLEDMELLEHKFRLELEWLLRINIFNTAGY
jgi:hypothetical protein